jgi:putative transport protein
VLSKSGSLKIIVLLVAVSCFLTTAFVTLTSAQEAPQTAAEQVDAVTTDAAPLAAATADEEGVESDAEATTENAGAVPDKGAEQKKQPGYLTGVFINSFTNTLFIVFAIAVVGYLFGRIQIKGVGLGAAGVFLAALVFGHFGVKDDSWLHVHGFLSDKLTESSLRTSMKLIQDLGLLCFVTSVGFIAGPKFFSNLKRNAKSYVLLAFVIIGAATLTTMAIIQFTSVDSAMGVGILSGALTTTPGFAAALDALPTDELKDICTVGHAIGYPFGVVGVVLFVQLVPKVLGSNMEEERKLLQASDETSGERELPTNLFKIDPIGLGPFALAICLGIILGKFTIPLPGGANFSLGNTGGALMMGLILGHYGRIGRMSMDISAEFLGSFREFGLIMFLIGAGVPGGAGFVEYVEQYGSILFVYGAIMEIVPLFLGFIVARYVVKLCLLNNLGCITGGMTSTPALGALINTAKTDDVASAYAATYPVALVLIVLASQMMVKFM